MKKTHPVELDEILRVLVLVLRVELNYPSPYGYFSLKKTQLQGQNWLDSREAEGRFFVRRALLCPSLFCLPRSVRLRGGCHVVHPRLLTCSRRCDPAHPRASALDRTIDRTKDRSEVQFERPRRSR